MRLVLSEDEKQIVMLALSHYYGVLEDVLKEDSGSMTEKAEIELVNDMKILAELIRFLYPISRG